jgi:hypothetical protein
VICLFSCKWKYGLSCDHHYVIEKPIQTLFISLSYDDKIKIIEEGT